MASINIRNIDEKTKLKFKTLAASNGRSMEGELRSMISKAVGMQDRARNVGRSIMDRFDCIGGVEIEIPQRVPARAIVNFEE